MEEKPEVEECEGIANTAALFAYATFPILVSQVVLLLSFGLTLLLQIPWWYAIPISLGAMLLVFIPLLRHKE